MPSTSKKPTADPARRRIRWAVTMGLCVLTSASSVRLSRATPPSTAAIYNVLIETMRFSPAAIKVRVGDRIDFKNTDLVPHTATSTAGQNFDSGSLEPGKVWSVTCDHEGEIAYGCTFHPTMKGLITVQPVRQSATD